jgi:hypothetical protein
MRIDVFLMELAVPVHLVRAGRRLNRAATAPQIRMLFYSRIDEALAVAFPVGQGFAGTDDPEEGVFLRAVGWNGEPAAIWADRQRMWYRHGQYWTSKRIVQTIAQKLHLAFERELPDRELPARAVGGVENERLESRRIG